MRNKPETHIMMALEGVAVLLGLTQVAVADAQYHLILLPDGATQVTNTGIVLSDGALIEPARDAQGNPVWDSDDDGVADGYTIRSLTTGDYAVAHAIRVNDELGLAVGEAYDPSSYNQPVLWTNIGTANGDGTFGTLVDLGKLHDAQAGSATDVNSRGQVLVVEGLRDQPSFPPPGGLVLVNPRDTDGDEVPDLWFEDLDGDGGNDLMIDLEGTIVGNGGGLRINELGQIVGESNNAVVDGFVILPEDADGDGQPDVWYRDADGDGANDLQISLGTEAHANDISDGGRIVGQLGPYEVERNYLMQWQIVPPDQVNVVVQEWAKKGGGFSAINENLQAVGHFRDYRTVYTGGFLWENGQVLDLIGLLDNPGSAEILVPRSINDSGTIAGSHCWWDNSVQHLRCEDGFIAVPIVPTPPPVCGDGACDPGEDECNCPADCGMPPTSETDCTDGIDNDCDGLVDCDDTDDCGGDPSCACSAKGEPCTVDSDCCSLNCLPSGRCTG